MFVKNVQYVGFLIFSSAIVLTRCLSAVTLWELDPAIVRQQINQRFMSIEAKQPVVGSVADRMIKRDSRTTPVRIYTPNSGKDFPIILFIHGGGWVAGNLDTHDNLARYLGSKAEAVVISVGYLNAPEGKFPLPLEQCYDALLWVVEHANEFRADASRLAVAGDSAGGNMAAALCLMNRDRSGPKIDLQVLINPAPDLTEENGLKLQNTEILLWYATQYLPNRKGGDHPYVSPIVAKELSGLPRAMILLAEQDELRESGQRYADRLRDAKVLTNVYIQWGIGHLSGEVARASLKSHESLDIAVTALRAAFAR